MNQPGDSLIEDKAMDDVVELRLSRAVAVTNTSFVRESVANRARAEGHEGPQVELVQFNVLVHCVRGTGSHMVDFEDIALRPGIALWIRPGQVQRWSETDDGFDADVVVFESSMIPELPLFEHVAGGPGIANLGDDSPLATQQIEWMAADLEQTNDTSVAAAVVAVILRLFARQASAGLANAGPRHTLANAFIKSIDDNIDKRSVTWHAQQIGASARSVARATTEALHLRPKEVIDSRVILEAQRRLAWSDDDIATIARSLRFTEASNFTKFFRSRTGMAPSEFRQSVNATADD